MNLLKSISDTINDSIQYTIDCPSLNTDGGVPILDFGASVENGKVVHGC